MIGSVLDQYKPQRDASVRTVRPGLCLVTEFQLPESPGESATLYINLASSDRVKSPPPSDLLNIPLCVSGLRRASSRPQGVVTRLGEELRSERVLDVVANPLIIAKCLKPGSAADREFRAEFLQLALSSASETIGSKVNETGEVAYSFV
ncbi:hypothetical protein HK405_009145 [Cladochytrium tenue]|nr:hypothetical protein HK405_009145 [Cladochytrium tenue]